MSLQNVQDLALLLERQKASIRHVVSMTCGTSGVRVVYQGTEAKTNGRVIYLPEIRLLLRSVMSDEQIQHVRDYMTYVWGAAWHEISHCLYSNFEQLTQHYTAHKPLQHIVNMYEDLRVNLLLSYNYPGCAAYLERTYNYIYAKAQTRYKDKKPSPFVQILLAITYSRQVKGYKQTQFWYMFDVKVRKFVRATRALHKKAQVADSTYAVIKYARKLLKMIKAEFVIPDEIEDTPNTEPKSDESEDDTTPIEDKTKNTTYCDITDDADDNQTKAVFDVAGEDSDLLSGSSFIQADIQDAVKSGDFVYCNYTDNDTCPVYRVYTTANDDIVFSKTEDSVYFNAYTKERDVYSTRSVDAKSLASLLHAKSKNTVVFDQTEGSDICEDSLATFITSGNKDIFTSVFERNTLQSTAIEFSVDCSASMSSRIRAVRNLVIDLAHVLDGTPIKYAVTAWSTKPGTEANHVYKQAVTSSNKDAAELYTRFGGLWLRVLKDFGEPTLQPHRVMGIAARQNSYDAESLFFSASRLLSLNVKRRILVVFVDGEPTPPEAHFLPSRIKLQQQALHAAVRCISSSAIEFVVFALDAPNVAKYYPKDATVNISGTYGLDSTVLARLRSVLSQSAKR